jgi:hypothetical protein
MHELGLNKKRPTEIGEASASIQNYKTLLSKLNHLQL